MAEKQERQAWRRWLTGPIVWMVYFTAVYLLVEAACEQVLFSATAVLPITLLLTVIALAFMANAFYQAWRSNDTSFAVKSSLSLQALFIFLTLAVGATVLVLSPC